MNRKNIIITIILEYMPGFLLNFLFSVVFVSLSLFLPKILQEVIDNITIEEGGYFLNKLMVFIFLSALLFLTAIVKKYHVEKLSYKISNSLRLRLLEKIVTFDGNFYANHTIGNIMEYFENDILFINEFISGSMADLLINLLTIIFVLFLFFQYQVWLGALFSFVMLALISGLLFMNSKKDNAISKERDFCSGLCGLYGEWMEEAREIHVLGKENPVFTQFKKMYAQVLNYKLKSQKFLYMIWCTALFVGFFANFFALFGGGVLYIHQLATIGEIFLLYSYSNKLKAPIEEMQRHFQTAAKFIASSQRISKVYYYIPLVKDGNILLDSIKNVEIKGLEYQFEEKIILQNVNALFQEGHTYGIFGGSGVGKSTLCKLMSKQYPVNNHMIFINGIDINDIKKSDLQKKMAYLSAKSQIFHGTLKDNLVLFNQKTDAELVDKKLTEYGIWEFFDFYMKHGLDTIISEQTLSKGEKQLINICRLLFVEKDFIIFDEAISDLDKEIEIKFFDILFRIQREKQFIMILISHDFFRLKKCDSIMEI